jgi:hypothetical protein
MTMTTSAMAIFGRFVDFCSLIDTYDPHLSLIYKTILQSPLAAFPQVNPARKSSALAANISSRNRQMTAQGQA